MSNMKAMMTAIHPNWPLFSCSYIQMWCNTSKWHQAFIFWCANSFGQWIRRIKLQFKIQWKILNARITDHLCRKCRIFFFCSYFKWRHMCSTCTEQSICKISTRWNYEEKVGPKNITTYCRKEINKVMQGHTFFDIYFLLLCLGMS